MLSSRLSLSPCFHCTAFPLAAFRFVLVLLLFDFYLYIFFNFLLCFFVLFLRKWFQLVNRVDFKKSVPSILVLIHFLSFMNACCQLLRYMFFCVSVYVCMCVSVQIRVKIIAIFLNICSCLRRQGHSRVNESWTETSARKCFHCCCCSPTHSLSLDPFTVTLKIIVKRYVFTACSLYRYEMCVCGSWAKDLIN